MESLWNLGVEVIDMLLLPAISCVAGIVFAWWFFGRAEYERGREEVRATVREIHAQLIKAQAIAQGFESEINKQNAELDQLEGDLEAERAQGAALASQLKSANERGRALEQEVAAARVLAAAKDKEMAALKQESQRLAPLADSARELAETRALLQARVEGLLGEKAAQESALEALRAEQSASAGEKRKREELEFKLLEMQEGDDRSTLKKELETAAAERDDLRRKLKILERRAAREAEAIAESNGTSAAEANAPETASPAQETDASLARFRGEVQKLEHEIENAVADFGGEPTPPADGAPARPKRGARRAAQRPDNRSKKTTQRGAAARSRVPPDVAQRLLFARGNGEKESKGGAQLSDEDIAADEGARDSLQSIRGIGASLERKLYGAGITTYRQIAGWSSEDVDRMAAVIGTSSSKIRGENWVSKARKLAKVK